MHTLCHWCASDSYSHRNNNCFCHFSSNSNRHSYPISRRLRSDPTNNHTHPNSSLDHHSRPVCKWRHPNSSSRNHHANRVCLPCGWSGSHSHRRWCRRWCRRVFIFIHDIYWPQSGHSHSRGVRKCSYHQSRPNHRDSHPRHRSQSRHCNTRSKPRHSRPRHPTKRRDNHPNRAHSSPHNTSSFHPKHSHSHSRRCHYRH